MDLNDFVKYDNQKVDKIINWFRNLHSKRIILDGPPGNGKTFLVELLCKEYNYHLHRIDPYDFRNKQEFNNIIKTLNLLPLDCKETKKVILIENINEFHKNYRKRLFEIHNICNYPIVITGYKINIPNKHRKKIEVFRLNKPTPTKIRLFLEKKLQKLNVEMDEETLEKISKISPSIRSAVNSLYNSTPNEITNPNPSYYEQLNNIKFKILKDNVNRNLVCYLFGNVKDFNSMNIFCRYEMELSRKFKTEMDKYLFNNMTFDFVSNDYPEFMNKQYGNGEDVSKYVKYLPELHISTRTLKTEFLDLLKILDEEKPKEDIKKNKTVINKQNILDFV